MYHASEVNGLISYRAAVVCAVLSYQCCGLVILASFENHLRENFVYVRNSLSMCDSFIKC